jgi:hypothetical protein
MKMVVWVLAILVTRAVQGAEPNTPDDGNKMLRMCASGGSGVESGYCTGRVEGWIDGVHAGQAMSQVRFSDRQVCVPNGATTGQNVAIFVKYLREHPEQRHESPSMLMLYSFTKAYPCKGGPR